MSEPLATIAALFRYPVKSMAGEPLRQAALGWHGLSGDRRLALRRVNDHGGFPFLSASRLPELVRWVPEGADGATLPTHLKSPDGRRLEVFGEALRAELTARHGSPVQMMHFDRGVFDEAAISVISTASTAELARLAGCADDLRRFRPNVVLDLARPAPFEEDGWVSGVLTFGDGPAAPAVSVTQRDLRCAMLNIDPATAQLSPELFKTVVRVRDNFAGVYCSVLRTGTLEVGQPVRFEPVG